MDTATIGVAQQEDREEGIDQQDIFYRVVFFLAAITLFLFSRVLGADDAPFGPVMGKRGEAAVAVGAVAMGAEPSGSGVTIVAAATNEPASRRARAER